MNHEDLHDPHAREDELLLAQDDIPTYLRPLPAGDTPSCPHCDQYGRHGTHSPGCPNRVSNDTLDADAFDRTKLDGLDEELIALVEEIDAANARTVNSNVFILQLELENDPRW